MTASHTTLTDANCIVGGYDSDNPLKIYVGGPCSGLTGSGDTIKTGDNFRWVEMQTVYMAIVDEAGTEAPFAATPADSSLPAFFAEDKTEYAEVGVAGSQFLNVDGHKKAALFSSSTSYLAKSSFEYNKNAFVIGKDANNAAMRLEQCVVSCCADGADPGATGCTCANGCPAKKAKASPGQYKYSIMAAAYDLPNPGTEGWQSVVNAYGKGTPNKQLKGNMDVYQLIDFTNMKADSLTVTPPTGAGVKYKDMKDCDMTTGDMKTGCPTEYSVKSMTVASDGDAWSGTYDFPMTFNLGQWNLDAAGTAATSSVQETRKVKIDAVKPSATTLTAWSLTATNKIVLIRYRFDITGVTGATTNGKFMNYDPTVTSGSSTKKGGNDTKTDATVKLATHSLLVFGAAFAMAALM